MNNIMKTLAISFTLLFAVPAFAGDCDIPDVPGLDKAAMAKLRVQCEQALLDAVSAPQAAVKDVVKDLTDPEAVSAWGTVAQEWAKALGIAAKELGIAVDEFLGTDAGKLTAVVIIWQVMGETILGFVIGIPLLAVVIIVGLRTARNAKIKSIVYDEEKTNWRGKPLVKSVTYFDEDQTAMFWLAHLATIVLSIWVVAGVIF